MKSQKKQSLAPRDVRAVRAERVGTHGSPLRRVVTNMAAATGVAVLALSVAGAPAVADALDEGAEVSIPSQEEQQQAEEAAAPEKGTPEDETSEEADLDAPVEEESAVDDETPEQNAPVERLADETPEEVQDNADEDVRFDDVNIVEDEQYDRGAVQVSFSLELSDGTREGDTTTLIYPELLRYDNSKEAVITLPDGTVIARGTLTDPANRVITFTFTDAVDRYRDIRVSGHFGMIVDDPAANSTPKDFTFVQNGVEFTDVVITHPAQRPPLTNVYVYGDWNAEDRGREQPDRAITWTANLPEGEWAGQTVTVSPSQGTSLFDCSTVEFFTTEVADGAIYHSSVYDENQVADGASPSYAEVISCSPDELVVQYTEPVPENFVRQIKVQAAVVDTDRTAQFGADVANSDLQLVEGGADIVPTTWYNFVARDVGIGEGDGTGREGAISIEKYSADEGLEAGDHDSAPGKALVAGGEETIVFEIANTGNEALTDIVLVDETLSGTALELGECALDGLVLEPGDIVTCEGILSHETAGQYADEATVTADTVRDGVEVSDSDPWYGTVPAPEPAPTPVPVAGENPAAPAPASAGELAATGMDGDVLPWALGSAALLLGAGASIAFAAHRRNRMSAEH